MYSLVFVLLFFSGVFGEFVPDGFHEETTPHSESITGVDKCGEGAEMGLYECVPYHHCNPDTNTIKTDDEKMQEDDELDYSDLIDIRFGSPKRCTGGIVDVCCKKRNETIISSTARPSTTTRKPKPKPKPTPKCGNRNVNGIDFKLKEKNDNEAEYGEFPWMVAILKTDYSFWLDPTLAICGGSLITLKVILTGAHCVQGLKPSDIKVRAGEWDTQTESERLPYQEQEVNSIIVHEHFNQKLLFNDVALIVLKKPFKSAKHISTICMPEPDQMIESKECYATGWGKDLFGKEGLYQVILKKIELPLINHDKCQIELKKTRLGPRFKLHGSFTCAGGIPGRDTCTGDGGSPLVCKDPNNPHRYSQVGIVSWGVGCGTSAPGVYVNVAQFRKWVDEKMDSLKLDTKGYRV